MLAKATSVTYPALFSPLFCLLLRPLTLLKRLQVHNHCRRRLQRSLQVRDLGVGPAMTHTETSLECPWPD